jgi:hypothetical protein
MDLDPIIRAGLGLAAFVGILSVVRMAIVPDGVGFEDLFGIGGDLEGPRGLPEEEPVRWRPECLTPWRGPNTTTRSAANEWVTDPGRPPLRQGSLDVSRPGRRVRQGMRRRLRKVRSGAVRGARRRLGQARARSLRIRSAASLPGAPITQPPGCVPDPHW